MRSVAESVPTSIVLTITEKSCDYEGNNCYTSERDVVTEGFHLVYALERSDVVKSDGLHATPYSAMRLRGVPMKFDMQREYGVTSGPGTAVYYTRTDHASGDIAWGYTPNCAKPNLSRNKAVIQALNRLGDVKVNLGILYAERAETLGLLSTYGKRLASLYSAFQRRDIGAWRRLTKTTPKQAAKQIANEGLAIQFGVMPIINDINGLIELMHEKSGTRKYAKVSGKDRDITTNVVEVVVDNPISGGDYMLVENKTVWKSGLKAHLTFTVDYDDLYRNLNRLGVFNPLSVAIDAIKWSWVVEWFISINGWAKSLTADVGCKFVTGCISTLDEAVVSERVIGTWVHPAVGPRDSDPIVGGSGASSTKWMNREVLLDVPFTVPYLKNPLGWFQALATLALVVQRLDTSSGIKRKPKQFRYRPPKSRRLSPINYVK